jgi:starvation-inducible DNA-binding protein
MATKETKPTAKPDTAGTAARPVPRELATPTNFATADVQAISEALTGLVADAFALYIKTKNFHWHLAGPRFRDLHLLFDEHADAIFASIDLLAERVRRVGGTTLRSIGQASRLTRVEDDEQDFVPAHEMVRRLMEDNQRMVQAMRQAHEVCDESNDVATASVLENLIDETERRIWFLFEIAQGLEAR